MPKPGPRPYECVRKAWHSDRHQPLRGSIIQEIFRIVNEVHGSATKKNKEWQEKLPIVVFRADEIMYSKANSEAEYMDLKTLWVRLNDAIDTFIKRDDNMESKSRDLLQPCIEAALHLVSPKRSSRSQRNNCPRYYLTPQPNSVPTGNSHDRDRGNNPSDPKTNKMLPFSTLKFPSSAGIQTLPMQTARASPTSYSVYPLYHGCQFEPSDPKFGSAKSNPQLVDDVSENQTAIGCDLSLRLGSLLVPCNRVQNVVLCKNDKAGDICKFTDLSPQFNRGLSFFLKENADKKQFSMSSNNQNLNFNSVSTKRKQGEDQQIYWPVKLPFNKFRS